MSKQVEFNERSFPLTGIFSPFLTERFHVPESPTKGEQLFDSLSHVWIKVLSLLHYFDQTSGH